jgi:hypothetical protein
MDGMGRKNPLVASEKNEVRSFRPASFLENEKLDNMQVRRAF